MKLEDLLVHIIDDVTLPFMQKLLKSEIGEKYFDTREKQYQYELEIVKLTAMLLLKPKLSFEKLEKASIFHRNLNIDENEMQNILNLYFTEVIEFIKKYNLKDTISEHLSEYKKYYMEKYHSKSEDEFFDFDSEVFDEEINNMHYEEHQKISAKEFMQENSFDKSLLEDLDEKLDEYYNVIEIKESLNQEDLEKVKKIFSFFAYIFNLSSEFRDIGYGFEKLNQFLDNFDINDENKSKMLKMFLDTIIDDLIKFKKEVFEDMSANDIHYLDASLLANISQIEISFSSLNSNEEDDDIFF